MTLRAGEHLGPYEILAPIGAGGMGEVYRARDPRLERDVAIKVLPASLSQDRDRLRRFEQEAKAAGSLNHPNVVAVYDVGSHEGAPYVVSELLEGETLRAVLSGGRLPTGKAADYALQMARGLAAAHEKSIAHRDLKPENVFVTKDGRIKILDFGLAKLTLPEAAAGPFTQAPTETPGTEPGVVLGTVGYMSPEQARGRPADVRSDIFSFGAILYEMLSGRRAFGGGSAAETMSAILRDEPPDLARTQRDVPAALERIVRVCLEKNPERRFHSAHDLALALSAAGESSARGLRRGRQIGVAAAAAILAAVALFLALQFWRGRARTAAGPGASAAGRKSIAVLPFQNLSPDPQNAFFADGMTEDILTQLAKIRDLKVISRTSVMRYKGTQKPIQAIASELGVATILEGSVRRDGDRVRIVGQLVDARTDEHLWAETYDRELKDVFAIQSDVAQRIAAALRATLSPAEKERIDQSPTRNLAAYDLYLKGRELYSRYTKSDNETAIEDFQKALQMDSGFALAYAGLGDAYAQRVQRFGFESSWLGSSLEMSRKAISLDPGLAEGYKALGLTHFVRGAYRESLDASRKAVQLNPSNPGATANVGYSLLLLGKADEALAWMRRGAELDPTSPVACSGVAASYAMLRDFRQAERWLRRSLELQPDLSQAHAFLVWTYLEENRNDEALQQARKAVVLTADPRAWYGAAVADVISGDLADARQKFEHVLAAYRGARIGPRTAGGGIETYLAYLELRAGERAKADRLLGESLEADRRAAREGNEDWSIPFDEACVHALRGEKDEAFRRLEKSVEAGWRAWPIGMRIPLLEPLRTDPRFQGVEARLQGLVARMRRRAGLN